MEALPGSAPGGRVIALGSVNADFQLRVERRPEVSETLLARDFLRLSGGKSGNVAFLVRKLGRPAQLLAHVGDDDLAEQALASLRESGVDLCGVRKMPGMSTGLAVVMVPPDGKKGIVMADNANTAWSDEDAADAAHAVECAPDGSVLVVNCEVPGIVLERAMRAARRRAFKVILDPSPADRVTDALLALSDITLPNPGETERLTGITPKDVDSAARAGMHLLERGVAAACIRQPDGGCVLVEREGKEKTVTQIAPTPVAVVDTTGAGDAFAGALGVALLEGQAIAEAARFAVAASHVAVTGYGAQPSYPTREQLETMKDRLAINTCTLDSALGTPPSGV